NQVNGGSIVVEPAKASGHRLGTIHDNIVKGGFIAILADTKVERFRISGNVVDCSGGPNAAFVLQTTYSPSSIHGDLKGNPTTNCPYYYPQYTAGTYTGLRPPSQTTTSD